MSSAFSHLSYRGDESLMNKKDYCVHIAAVGMEDSLVAPSFLERIRAKNLFIFATSNIEKAPDA